MRKKEEKGKEKEGPADSSESLSMSKHDGLFHPSVFSDMSLLVPQTGQIQLSVIYLKDVPEIT
jgi:hypothetical protein